MKKYFSTFIAIFIFLAGLSLLLYPTVSNFWNQYHATEMMAAYSNSVSETEKTTLNTLKGLAKAYNAELAEKGQHFYLSDLEKSRYQAILNLNGDGIIGTLQIPAIHVDLPVYHGTEDKVLQQGIGHLEWSSFPVGGESTHAVISGHRGLPSAKLLTDLDKVKLGDIFTITVLDETLTYQVDQILVVEPDDTSALMIEEGKDYCTLFACTPYGINTHRLLVRGIRTETTERTGNTKTTLQLYLPLYILVCVFLLMILLGVFIKLRRKRRDTSSASLKASPERGGGPRNAVEGFRQA